MTNRKSRSNNRIKRNRSRRNLFKNIIGGEKYPKYSTVQDLKDNKERLLEFKTYLERRIAEGKQNWLVTGAMDKSHIVYDKDGKANYGNYTEKSRFSNENWVFFDIGVPKESVTQYHFVGDAELLDNWIFLGNNFRELFHYITSDYSFKMSTEIFNNMKKMICNKGIIWFSDDKFTNDDPAFNNYNKAELSNSPYIYFFKVLKNNKNKPFFMYSGGGGRLQGGFFDYIHNNPSLLGHLALDPELKALYYRLLDMKHYSTHPCIEKYSSVSASFMNFIDVYNYHCIKKPEYRIEELSQVADRIYSTEIEEKMYEFIRIVSLEWKPPSPETLVSIYNDESVENADVRLMTMDEIDNLKKYTDMIAWKSSTIDEELLSDFSPEKQLFIRQKIREAKIYFDNLKEIPKSYSTIYFKYED